MFTSKKPLAINSTPYINRQHGLLRKKSPFILHFCLTFVIKLGIITKMLAMANNITTEIFMDLTQAQTGKEYVVTNIQTDDQQLDAFLFSLGCYSGQPITVVSRQKSNCIVLV